MIRETGGQIHLMDHLSKPVWKGTLGRVLFPKCLQAKRTLSCHALNEWVYTFSKSVSGVMMRQMGRYASNLMCYSRIWKVIVLKTDRYWGIHIWETCLES